MNERRVAENSLFLWQTALSVAMYERHGFEFGKIPENNLHEIDCGANPAVRCDRSDLRPEALGRLGPKPPAGSLQL